MRTLNSLFTNAVSAGAERMFLRRLLDDGSFESVSRARAAAAVVRVIQALRRTGASKGDPVVAHMDSIESSVYFTLACFHVGAIPAFLSPVFSNAAAQKLQGRLGAKAVFTLSGHAGTVGLDTLLGGVENDCTMRARDFLEASVTNGGLDDACLFQPTSGSTGEPKLVVTPQRSFLHVRDTLLLGVAPGGEHRVLLVSPLTHGVGMCGLVAGMLLDASFDIPRTHDTAVKPDDVRLLDSTFVYTTPRVLVSLDGQLGPSMQHVMVAGAPPNQRLLEELVRKGISVREIYASSESGELVMTSPGEWKSGIVGKACSGVELRVSEDGELLARGPGQMLGYYGDPEATAACMTDDGLYRTGDLAEIGADGDVKIQGRKKDVLNSSEGMNIYPARIEEMLRSLPWVRQAVVVGDQQPFLSAVLVAESEVARQRIVHDVREINEGLESMEQIRRVFLRSESLMPDAYAQVGLAKVRVDRASVERLVATWPETAAVRVA